jgi:hypothetical protein
MDKTLAACEQSFTTDITEHTPTYVALQDIVRNYVEEQGKQK